MICLENSNQLISTLYVTFQHNENCIVDVFTERDTYEYLFSILCNDVYNNKKNISVADKEKDEVLFTRICNRSSLKDAISSFCKMVEDNIIGDYKVKLDIEIIKNKNDDYTVVDQNIDNDFTNNTDLDLEDEYNLETKTTKLFSNHMELGYKDPEYSFRLNYQKIIYFLKDPKAKQYIISSSQNIPDPMNEDNWIYMCIDIIIDKWVITSGVTIISVHLEHPEEIDREMRLINGKYNGVAILINDEALSDMMEDVRNNIFHAYHLLDTVSTKYKNRKITIHTDMELDIKDYI